MLDYKVLSRKYRPKKLNDVVGQDFAVRTITNAFELNKLSHAFLFTGIRGVGKTTIARIIAMGLNCEKDEKPKANPCEKCNNCRQILEERFEDVLEIDAASHTGVDDIREIISSLKYKPTKGKFKVFIIDEVHMLSNSAFNALLKTIEEPPDFVKFIFCTTELNKIPITIISRCQKFHLKRVHSKDIMNYLISITKLEKFIVSKEALSLIAKNSEGSIRDSLTILDQCILNSNKDNVEESDVIETIGLTSQKYLFDLFCSIIEGEITNSVNILNKIYQQGADPQRILEDLLNLTYDFMSMVASKKDNNDLEKRINEKISAKCNVPFLNQIWQMLIKGKQELNIVVNKIEALEILVIRIAYSCRLPSLEEVVKNIKKEKNNEFNLNIDNNDLGSDIKKILDTFPGSKIIEKDSEILGDN